MRLPNVACSAWASTASPVSVPVAWALTGVVAVGYHQAPELTGFVVGPLADKTLVMLLFVFLSGTLVGAYPRVNGATAR